MEDASADSQKLGGDEDDWEYEFDPTETEVSY